MDEDAKEYNESARRGAFYAESWALAHYLLSGPERRGQILEFLRLAQGGTPGGEAFQKASAPIHRPWSGSSRPTSRATVPLHPRRHPAGGDLTGRPPMARADVLFRLGDLLANHGGRPPCRRRRALPGRPRRQPDHGPAMAGLGFLAELAGRPDGGADLVREGREARAGRLPRAVPLCHEPHRRPRPRLAAAARAALTRKWWPSAPTSARPGPAWATPSRRRRALPRGRPSAGDGPPPAPLAHGRGSQPRRGLRPHRPPREGAGADRARARPPGRPELVENAREALLDEDYRQAEELVEEQKLGEAPPVLQRAAKTTRRPERRRALELRDRRDPQGLDFNHFVDQYNQAVELANRGDVKGAVAILEPLVGRPPWISTRPSRRGPCCAG